ncbi:MAG: hydantoinase B/oxoprolinase family protein [Bryobacteraceae bacterium]|nr:hydantoinase B/oxoprolinase family protein [Bryobacteraceae bacterium]
MTGATNPIELELFRHLLASICEEMGIVLRKTAFSANIKERRDYSCAIYDAGGETAAMGDHMPVHLGAMPLSVRCAMERIRLQPGDVAILNDPFQGGTHLPDITAVSGVFLKGRRTPQFLLANRAHHSDVGGISPGSMPLAREIYQEGIRIPPLLLASRGRIRRDILDLIRSNVRTPEEREGDLLAQWMSIQRGADRLTEVTARFGPRRVARNMLALQDYTERMMRAALAKLPRGTYRFEDSLDDDGVSGRPVRIRVTIRIAGHSAVVDFSGTDPQTAGPVNANFAVTLAAVTYVFRCLLEEEAPFTSGLMRPVTVIAPEGTVVNARPPAAMAAGNVETSQRITDALLGALAQAAPERIPAASSGTMNNLSLGGRDPFRNRPFAYYETIAGGMGASARSGGLSAVHTHMTNSWNTPIEAFEHQYPVRVAAYRIRAGSGGPGARRGGDGIVRELEFLAPCEITLLSDRRAQGPYGLGGGGAGKPGRNSLIRGGKRIPLAGKTTLTALEGDVLRIETPGGGGHGAPPAENRALALS